MINLLKIILVLSLAMRFFLVWILSDPLVVNTKQSRQKHIEKVLMAKVKATTVDKKWISESNIDVEKVKQNLTLTYQERRGKIEEICQREKENQLLQQANQLHHG